MRRLLALTILVCAPVAATTAGAAVPAFTPCSGAELSATFNVVRGSAGAGNIVYLLRVKNISTKTCTVTGLPKGTLLNKAGKAQTTHILNAGGNTNAMFVKLAPGKSTTATARFSPDVPGVGEGKAGQQCEPTSYWFRLSAPGGGTTKARISPATPVCEHGRLQFSYYGHTYP